MRPKLPYLSSLQGLRGISIAAVILYHLQPTWLPGGFLGVEIFFVVSGYLITSLLVQELREHNRIKLRAFYARRARRLVPAAYVLIAGVILLALVAARAELVQLRQDVAASLLYVQNWHLIFSGESYFTFLGQPSLLQHLWSMAIEGQFYLVWPVIVMVCLGKRKKLRRQTMFLTAVLLAVTSQVAAAYIAAHVSNDRAYYGTDTRLTGLLLGSALALYIRPAHLLSTQLYLRSHKIFVSFIGVMALGGIVFLLFRVSPYGRFPYFGGFLLVDVLAITVLVAASLRGSIVHKLLAMQPLRWLGDRSYSIYLWHWPVFILTRTLELSFWAMIATQLVVALILAEMSYAFIETPLRRRFFPEVNKDRTSAVSLVRFSVVLVALTISVIFYFWPSLLARTWVPTEYLQARQEIEGELGAKQSVSLSQSVASQSLQEPIAMPLRRPVGTVTVVGDSVTLGAGQSIMQKIGAPVIFNAEVGRNPSAVAGILRELDAQGQVGPTVVIATGWNGLLTDKHFDEIKTILGPNRRVYWVLPTGDRPWISQSSALLRSLVPITANHNLIPWEDFSASHPEWFAYDGIHVAGEGAERFAGLIYQAILTR